MKKSVSTLVATVAMFFVSTASAEPVTNEVVSFTRVGAEQLKTWYSSCAQDALKEFVEKCNVHKEAVFSLRKTLKLSDIDNVKSNIALSRGHLEMMQAVNRDAPKFSFCESEKAQISGCIANLSIALTTLRGGVRAIELQKLQ